MKYRSDIDGLRAIAVVSVIAFHSGIVLLSGGYVGVDVFFVISGYLITTLIFKEIKNRTFSFRAFYKRRAARLLPALSVTFAIVSIFGLVFYNNQAFDNLGKELFFSSFGAANILFANGVNYFAKDEAYQPLIHLWSLGVEEQFYIIWPILLLLAYRFYKSIIMPLVYILFFISLALSISAVEESLTKGYFLLQYRAFELLVGVITALHLQHNNGNNIPELMKKMLSYFGMFLIVIPMFLLNKNSSFPGYNALWPCLGTALIIAFPNNGLITKILSHKSFIFIGLISYPLYLYHQPLISFIYFLNFKLQPFEIFSVVLFIAILGSWLTYKFIEIPIRKLSNSNKKKSSILVIGALCTTIPLFAILGIGIAKSNGFENRFRVLNPFALEVSNAHASSFHENFERGFNVSHQKHSKVLFLGDSVLQHYVLPMQKALNLKSYDIDTVTRGGCVLLKNVNFIDKFSDVSCNDIRDKLYNSKKTYDYVVISQSWDSYDDSVLNFSAKKNKFERWSPLLEETINHFQTYTNNIIIIGAHLSIDGALGIQPSVTITKEKLHKNLRKLKVKNLSDLKNSKNFFIEYEYNSRVKIIEPYNIFCELKCQLHDNNWSYFSDSQHVSNASTSFIKTRFETILSDL
ncbi:MAG: acyltransferase family protein [Hellea sp.]